MRKTFAISTGLLGMLAAGPVAAPQSVAASVAKTRITGLVRDIACPIQNKESSATKFNLECAKQCAKAGSPLVILTDDGTMYFPISATMPDLDQRQRLMPFVGKYVVAEGVAYERKGTHAIMLNKLEEDHSKDLVKDAFAK